LLREWLDDLCRLFFIVRKVEFGLVVLAALDDGIDEVGLAALRDLFAHKLPDLGGVFIGGARVTMGVRPGGISSMTETSRSP